MADDTKYNIISVNSDDDDEIVIEAGARKRKQAPQPEQGVVHEEDVVEPADGEDGEAYAEPTEESAERNGQSQESPDEDDGYRETTLEDLKTDGPMGRTRLIILGLALLVLVGFLIYYNFLR